MTGIAGKAAAGSAWARSAGWTCALPKPTRMRKEMMTPMNSTEFALSTTPELPASSEPPPRPAKRTAAGMPVAEASSAGTSSPRSFPPSSM